MGRVRKILFIQTAFIGDAILASSMWESWHAQHPEDELHVCVRAGNESLFRDHPFLAKVHVWQKRGGSMLRYSKLVSLGLQLRKMRFDVVITPHRHASSGILARLTAAPHRAAFDQHPLRPWFTHGAPHRFEAGLHETQRNHALLEPWLNEAALLPPRLYPSTLASLPQEPFGVMAPTSQWGTKQWPEDKWVELCNRLREYSGSIVLLRGASDFELLNRIQQHSVHPKLLVCTHFSLLESAGAMKQAQWVIANDSGPLHLASAVDAATVAIFCSTTPDFGFGPVATKNAVIESTVELPCRPCGLHGHRSCPEGHYRCGIDIQVDQVLKALSRWSSTI